MEQLKNWRHPCSLDFHYSEFWRGKYQDDLSRDTYRHSSTKGEMTIRVYSSWDKSTSEQAKKTQKWQLSYFVDMSDPSKLPIDKIIELYSL
ncbi:MepB family protein [Psychrobacillus sp. FSL K6-1464]|uniref:MepB family protein n=1 Tax=Psychrobacillus sp. FSL K6-1464 TaxID=2921545 RepID=UPI0030FABBC3